jgi:hypothetical protein
MGCLISSPLKPKSGLNPPQQRSCRGPRNGAPSAVLRDEQKVELSLVAGGDKFGARRNGHTAILGKEKIVIQKAVSTEPKVLDTDLRSDSVRCAYHSPAAQVTKLFVAIRIHALRNHGAPLGYTRKNTPGRLPLRSPHYSKVVWENALFSTQESK